MARRQQKDQSEDQAERHLFVIFGATGDLARKKLLPAVYHLLRSGELEDGSHILGISRNPDMDDESFREWAVEKLRDEVDDPEAFSEWCASCLHFETAIEEGGYEPIAKRIEEIEKEEELPGNRLFYLALPPSVFPEVIRGLGEAGLGDGPGWTRLVVEKPFGRDLESARNLNELVHRWFGEDQIYRIDHYLGKETVQNLLVFRFANVVFESLWHRERVDNVQITVAEDVGVDGRGGYYEQAGALRDMVQNHLTQLLTLTAMEVPVAYDADSIRFEKVKVLRAIQPIGNENVVLGQYGAGSVGGEEVKGYREEEKVATGSDTETFVAMKLTVDSWRWQGVPFYLRTGKRMPKRLTEIAVTFRRPPICLFESLDCEQVESNLLLIRLQPDEGFKLFFDVKRPGEPLQLKKKALDFYYGESFDARIPDAYETLLLDVMLGEQTLFVHADEVEESWRLYTPLIERSLPVHPYEAGSWGPAETEGLPARDGNYWRSR